WKSAEFETGEKLTSSGMSDFYFRKTLDFARNDFGAQIRLLGRKVGYLLSPVEHGNNGSPEFFKRYSPPLRSPFAWGLFVVLSAAGLPLILRRRKAGVLLLWGLLYGATVVIFFVNARFRLPLLTAAVPMASAGVFCVYDSLAKRDFRGFGISLGLAIFAVAAFALGDNTRLSPRGEAESYFALGNVHLRAGRAMMADSAYARALEIAPAIDRASLNRGIIAFEMGEYARAKEFFAEEIAKGGEISMANSNLGVIARLERDTASAIKFGAEAVEADPINSKARINLAQSLVEFDYEDSALSVARGGLELDSLNRRLQLVAGTACLSLGRVDTAVDYFRAATFEREPSAMADYELSDIYSVEGGGASPDSVIRGYALYNLGLAEAMRGEFTLALEAFAKALHLIPNHADIWASYGGLLTQMNSDIEAEKALLRAIELGKGSPEVHYNLGLIYARAGKFPEAYARFTQSVEIDSSFMPGREKIDILEKLEEDGKISLEIK
ncbi:MAG: tetratricopeptide repeat protein, partial [bacterium]